MYSRSSYIINNLMSYGFTKMLNNCYSLLCSPAHKAMGAPDGGKRS